MKSIVTSLMLGTTALLAAGCCCHKGYGVGGCPPAGPACPPVVQPGGYYGAYDPLQAVPTAGVAVSAPVVYAPGPTQTAYVPLNSLPTY